MRPKVVIWMLVLVECFLLVMIVSPGVTHPWPLVKAITEYSRTRSPEDEQKVRDEQARARRFQMLLCIAAVIVLIGTIIYGSYRKL